jgi:ElaB/YqjD/DUF883 family membrane-anchored ribosome-binding protein
MTTRDLVYELHTMDFELAHEAAEEIKRLRNELDKVDSYVEPTLVKQKAEIERLRDMMTGWYTTKVTEALKAAVEHEDKYVLGAEPPWLAAAREALRGAG